MTDNGVRYTRNGNFTLDKDGFLVNSQGSKVLGTEGYIQFPELTKNVSISENGEVYHGDERKGLLSIKDFAKPYQLTREGDSCFRPLFPDVSEVQAACSVQQGYLEASNVNAVKNMVDMITSFRTYEAGQKALQAQDSTLEKAVNQIGKL
jgi:flagellar basal-body rod protein FlgG